MGQAECKGCMASDATSDTVRINATLLDQPQDLKTANTEVVAAQNTEQAEEERKKQEELEGARRRLERELEEQERRKEEQRLRAAQQQAEEERACREQDEAELAARAVEEQEAQAAAEVARRAEEARLAVQREQVEAQKRVDVFLRARGFKNVATPQRKCMSTTYPLHVAVQDNSVEMVRALLRCGADASAKNSSGKTALQVAEKLNKKESHKAVLVALRASAS